MSIENVPWSQMPFGPFVMKTKLPDYIIKRLHTDGKKKLKSYNSRLAGHLKSQFLYNPETTGWFYKETQPIWDCFRTQHCAFHGIESLPVELDAHDLWVNFMKAGDFNPMHTHGGDYSFVVFVDVPDKLTKEQEEFEGTSAKPGMLMFEYTQQAKPRWATTGQTIKPQTGDMFIFPALLQHWVAPFKSKVTRVSVSGNLQILNKDKLPNDYF